MFKLPYRTHNYLVCGIVECSTVKLDRRLTKFDISVFAWYGNLYDVMNCIMNIQNVSNEHASNIASIKELCKIGDKLVKKIAIIIIIIIFIHTRSTQILITTVYT